MKRDIRIPVRDLVEYTLRSGDLVMDFSISSGIRAVDGIRAHQKIQEARPEEYRSEITVSHRVETKDFTITIAGRIDGVYHYADHIVVDEIKTTTRNPDTVEKEQNPMHWGQVKVYAYLYAVQQEPTTIEVQLTYYQPDTGESRELRQAVTLEELEIFFNDLLNRYLQWLATLEKWHRLRDESIIELEFPYPVYRPGQRRMALDIYYAIEKKEQMILEAPTGIGKTMAAVFPAVKAMGSGLTEKFFYLTAKTTGRAIAQKALDDLRKKGLKLKSLTLTAKEKTCFNPESACNGEECEFARGYYDRINEAVETIFQRNSDALTRETVEAGAREFNVCPFEFSLELSLWVDGIICDYNYAFDPRVYLRRFFSEEMGKRDFTFLVDEANNMVDRSREMFSAELFKKSFLDLKGLIKKKLPEMSKSLGGINSLLLKYKKECEEAGKPMAREDYPADISPPLRRFIRAAERWLVKNIKAPFRQEVLALYFEVSWFLKTADNYHSGYASCFEVINKDFRLKLFCIDPSLPLSEALDRCSSVIFFSATLAPIDYFRHILGCDPAAKETVLSSPFPPGNLCLLAADRLSTLYKYRERTKTAIARIIHALVFQQPGNYLVFFPSYQYMKMVHEVFLLMNPMVEHLLVQTPGMSELEREEFLENFSLDNRTAGKTLVGFAVMGGVFGEGIDLVGDRLTGAAVVGVGLPGISLERELIKDYFTAQQGTGFEYAYLYPGMNRVFQAAGRVIRSANDRGVVLLIGHRFSTPQYKSLFPGHWHPIPVQDDRHLREILDGFWTLSEENR